MVLTGAPDTMLCRCCADVVPKLRLQVPEPVFVNTRKEYPSKIAHMRKILQEEGGFEFTVLPIAELNDGGLCAGNFTVVLIPGGLSANFLATLGDAGKVFLNWA